MSEQAKAEATEIVRLTTLLAEREHHRSLRASGQSFERDRVGQVEADDLWRSMVTAPPELRAERLARLEAEL